MKSASKRVKIVLIVVALALAGVTALLISLFSNSSEWAVNRRNALLYNSAGEFVGSGAIYDTNGAVLSRTVDGSRVYNEDASVRKALLHVVGDSQGFMSTGIQNAYETELSGYNIVEGVWELKKYGTGSSITLTVDSNACKTAYEALAGRKGAVCVYNYRTGEILVDVSTPTYDPQNKPSNIDGNKQYEGVYVDRVINGLYPPGSTFKTITAAAAIDSVPGVENEKFYCPGAYVSGKDKITCMSTHGNIDFSTALAQSCNTAFATIANEVGAPKLSEYAQKFGFNTPLTLDSNPVSKGKFSLSGGAHDIDVGWAGIGQYTTMVSPFIMMRAMGIIANSGTPTEPYLIKDITTASGIAVYKGKTKVSEQVISEATAKQLGKMLRNDVRVNYGDYQFGGMNVCAKSGTAEVEDNDVPHAWFVGYCSDEDNPYAFAVIVENGGSGSRVACPVAAKVLKSLKK